MAMKYITYAAIPLMAASLSTQAATVDQLSKQVQKLNQRIAASDQRFKINGFATFGLSTADEEVSYDGVKDEVNYSRYSRAGVQMTFNLDSKSSVVTQLVSRGANDWKTTAEWAFFKYQINDNLAAKVGRIRTPAFMLSEFLDVTYAVPWTAMPIETYNQLDILSNMDGADLTYSMDIGDYIANFKVAVGRSISEEYDIKDIISFGANLQADTWSTSLIYSEAAADIVSEDAVSAMQLHGHETTGISGEFLSLGFQYDPGDIYFSTEATQRTSGPGVSSMDAAFASFGYRFGQLMPTITYGMVESTDDDERTLDSILANNPDVAEGTSLTAAIIGGLNSIANAGGADAASAGAAAVALGATGSPTRTLTKADLDMVLATSAVLVDPSNPGAATATNLVLQGTLDGAQAAAEGVLLGQQILDNTFTANTTRIGLGLRYDFSAGTALKVQYDIIETTDGKAGEFDAFEFAGATTKPDATNILTITIDTVF